MKPHFKTSLTCAQYIALVGVSLKPRGEAQGAATCKAKYHDNEPMEFFCEDCRVCICHKCGQTSHNNHRKLDVKEAAEQQKAQMVKFFDRVKAKAGDIQAKMKKQAELMKENEDEMNSVEKKMKESVEDKIRLLNEHRTAMKTKIDEAREAEKNKCAVNMEKFEMLSAELQKSFECGLGYADLDILQTKWETVLSRYEELLNAAKKIEVYRPKHVCYDVSKETLRFALGDVVALDITPLQSPGERDGFNEVQLAGTESDLTVTTRQAGRKPYDVKEGKVTSKTKRLVKGTRGDFEYVNSKSHESHRAGVHDVAVQAICKPLSAVPGCEQVAVHTYKKIRSFEHRQLREPVSIAVSAKNGNIVIADVVNQCVHLYNPEWKYLRPIPDKGTGDGMIGLDMPRSVAFTASGDIIVIHGNNLKTMSVFTECGNFITHITEHLSNPRTVSVGKEGNLVVCESFKVTVKILSPDGQHLIQTIRDPYNCDIPEFAFHHQDKVFVSYQRKCCITVFSQDGHLLQKIGCKGTGDGQLKDPQGLTIDRFGNLVVCDTGNNRMHTFSVEGKFLNSFSEGITRPVSVVVTKNGDLLVCNDSRPRAVFMFSVK